MLDPIAISAEDRPLENHPMVRWFMLLSLFSCGFFAWIFKPRFGLYGTPIIPYSPLQVGLPLLGLGAFAYLLLAARLAVFRVTQPTSSSFFLKLGSVLIAFGAALHISLSDEGTEAFLFVIRWMLPLCFLSFMIAVRLARVSPVAMLYGLIGGALFSALCTEAFRAGAPLPIAQMTAGRFGAFLNHPNQYGIVIATTSPTIIFFGMRRGFFPKLVAGFTLLLYALCLFQAQSKTNILLIVVALGLSYFLLSLYDWRKFSMSLMVAFFGFFALLGIGAVGLQMLEQVAPKDAKTIEEIVHDPRGARSVEERMGIWEMALATIKRHPAYGVGPGQTINYLPLPHAHNLFLQLYLDSGLAGFVGICLVVLSVLLHNLETLKEARRLTGPADDETRLRLLSSVALLIYVLGNLMSDSFNTATMSTFVLFAGIAYGYRPIVHPKSVEEPMAPLGSPSQV